MILRIIGALVTGVQNIIISNRLTKIEGKTNKLLKRQERLLRWIIEQEEKKKRLEDKS